MQFDLVSFLRCPKCRGHVILEEVDNKVGGNIISGSLRCHDCYTTLEIKNGILDMLGDTDAELLHEIEHWNAIAVGSKKHPACNELREELSSLTNDLFARIVNKYLQKKDSIVVVEVGCGTSETVNLLPLHPDEVTYIGVDVSIEMLIGASRRRRAGWKTNLIRGDANKCFLKEGVVDLVISFAALHHLDLEKSLNVISSILKEGGLFMFHEPNRLNIIAQISRKLIQSFYTKSEKPLSPSEVKMQAESCGLVLRKQISLFPIALFYAYFVGLLHNFSGTLAKTIRALDRGVFHVDGFLRKTPLGYPLSASFFQLYEKVAS